LFAAAVVKVYRGYEFERHSGKSGDRGVDVHMKNQIGLPVIVQAKHYSTTNSVGSPDMQKFGGALLQHRPVRAVFVTSSYFSSEAKQFIRSDSRIETIDGHQIHTLLQSPIYARAIAEAYADIIEKKRRAG
jgi:restriction endonuclease Mrr